MGGGLSTSRSPTATSPALLARSMSSSGAIAEYDSPDEATGIVMRGPDRNYQSTMTQTQTSGSGPRGRKNGGASRTSGESAPGIGNELPPPELGIETGPPPKPWYKTLVDNLKSIELENKGSVARDHLALGKTFNASLCHNISVDV
jgi:hypothetical protein